MEQSFSVDRCPVYKYCSGELCGRDIHVVSIPHSKLGYKTHTTPEQHGCSACGLFNTFGTWWLDTVGCKETECGQGHRRVSAQELFPDRFVPVSIE